MMQGSIDSMNVIALGANLPGKLGSSVATLESALERFGAEGLDIVKRSKWWRSAAWPDPSQPDYINGVVLVETSLSPGETLAALHRIETALGRQRTTPNASRTIDLDLIACGRQQLDEPGLVLPHPRAGDRLFVMGPLAEIAPDWMHPALGKSAWALAATASIGLDSRPVIPV